MRLEAGSQCLEHQIGVLAAGLFHLHGREAASQGRIALDHLLVFVVGRRPDTRQLTLGQRKLQVRSDFLAAVAGKELVDLVEEQHHAPGACRHFLLDRGEARGQSAAHARAGEQLRDG